MKYAKLLPIVGFLLFAANSTLAIGPLFCARMDYIVGQWPGPIFSADFNSDGYDDIALGWTWEELGGTIIFLNNGDGTFQSPVGYSSNTLQPRAFISADFDGDNDNDLAVGVSTQLSSGFVYVLINNGDGTFQEGDVYSLGQSTPVRSIFSADFDGDNDFDIAAACSPSATPGYVAIMLNNGDGTFLTPVNYQVGHGLKKISSSDLDGDGDYDLAATGTAVSPGDVSVLLNNGDGTFGPPVTYLVGINPVSIVSVDLDGDDDYDLVAGGPDSVYVLLNNGNGTFQTSTSYFSGGDFHSIATADFDSDNDYDLAIAQGEASSNVSILLNDGNGGFQDLIYHDVGVLVEDIVSANFNGDTDPDLATSNPYYESISTLLNNGDAAFQLAPSNDVGDSPFSVVSADLNGDGYEDLATANSESNDISILMNNGDGTFQGATNYGVGNGPISVFAADFDSDLDIDLGVAAYYSHSISILMNNGDGTFLTPANYYLDSGPRSLFSADFNGDGADDLAVTRQGTYPGYLSVLLNNGDGTFQPAVSYNVGNNPTSVFSADFDNDNDMDLAVGASYRVYILLNDGAGSFTSVVFYDVENEALSIFSSDFDGDDDHDLAAAGLRWFNDASVAILLNNGDGTFQVSANYDIPPGLNCISSADFDGDYDSDLAVKANSCITILINNGSGSFQQAGNYGAADSPSYIFSADLDSDGDYDLAVTNSESDNVSILMNLSNTTDIRFEEISVPDEFAFYSYPNPFNAVTTIKYNLPKASEVNIEIYDILGRRVQIFVRERQRAGYHSVVWNADEYSSGMYFYRIQAGEFTEAKKMLLLK